MQHLEATAQVAAKQRVLEDNLERLGKVRPERILPPVLGPSWGYRNRARLSVHYVAKKGGVLVGFHERRSGFVADTMSCEVLHRASAANAEVAAARHHALRAFAQHLRHPPEVEVAARAPEREGDAFAGDAAIEERDLAIDVRDPDPLVVDRLDESLRHEARACRAWSARR